MNGRGEILVVDDDPDIAELVAAGLSRAGYRVTHACCGEEALEKVGAAEFDLVLLDIMMPGMGGLAALREIRKAAPSAEVVMLTAHASLDTAVAAMRLGASDYIRKPFTIEELAAVAERAVEKRRFAEVAAAGFRSRSLDEVARHAAAAAARLFGGEESAVLLEEGGGEFRVAGASGGNAGRRMDLYRCAMFLLEGSAGEPLALEPSAEPTLSPLIGAAGLASALFVPLTEEGRLTGAVCVLRPAGERPFSEAEAGRARLFGPLVALALRNSRLSGQLWEAREQLVQTQKMEALGLLASQISHDFNNLLAVIIGSMQLIMEGPNRGQGKLPEEVLKMARDAEVLVKQLLQFARGAESEARPSDLSGALNDMKGLLSRLPGPKVSPRYYQEAGLPPVRIKPVHFKQIVLNLVSNAKSSASESCGVTVSLRRAGAAEPLPPGVEREGCVVLEVADDGPGIPREIMRSIFEPFFTTKGEGKGTGLGLHIVRTLVTGCGGEILAGNREGGGAVFRVFLPSEEVRKRSSPAGP